MLRSLAENVPSLLKASTKNGKIPFVVHGLRHVQNLNVAVKYNRCEADRLVDRIDPLKFPDTFKQFWPVLGSCIQNGVKFGDGAVFHLYDLNFRQKGFL